MKIDLRREVLDHTPLSTVILNSLSTSIFSEIIKECEIEDRIEVDVKMIVTANNKEYEINVQKTIKSWESQVDEVLEKAAKELIEDKCSDISNLLYDLEERLKDEVNKRLEDWEKEK